MNDLRISYFNRISRKLAIFKQCLVAMLCLSQFQLGTSPPGNPWEKFFWASESRPPGQFFRLIPLPWGKNDGRIPRGGAKFSQTRRNYSLKLAKNPKKTTRQYKIFYLESLTKPLYFKLKQNHSKVLSPTLIFN